MAFAWNFKREEAFDIIPEGRHRVRIEEASIQTSKRSGNDMLVLKLAVSGFNSNLYSYTAFLDDRPEITNRMLTSIFDSFGIAEGDFNLAHYTGKVGACVVKHETGDDGTTRARISWFIPKNKQDDLPPWRGNTPTAPAKSGKPGKFVEITEQDDDLPFDT